MADTLNFVQEAFKHIKSHLTSFNITVLTKKSVKMVWYRPCYEIRPCCSEQYLAIAFTSEVWERPDRGRKMNDVIEKTVTLSPR